ncbi:NAD-dependent 4,6-dehydratase LegB [Azospirillum thermophilum]|uniref:NAD-dependent dehydratase n=1 Tax=Azospirillum thermophilum TaxID=2202148 RepID=A0A2S2D1D2_9PROT|nr:NAD-dependent 4,6-dehydratase LegB [Azospirillum thermophilum]AWK90247.1 NAD-dependent dehydratase [Azospirillum thermophilum]
MIDIARSTVLVTGADGFIGSHLVEALVARGAAVRAFVQYNSFGRAGWLDTLPAETRSAIGIIAGDIRDPSQVRAAVQGCGVILHLAALIAIPYSYRAAHSYVETNVTGTLNVLEAAREAGIERLVHTSTSEVYGTPQRVPIDETHPLNAQSPYAATKIAADQLALSFHKSFGIPVTVLRPFNTYGPRQSARALIPTIITQIARGAGRIRLGALTPTRDFSFVTDTASGFIAAAEADTAVGKVTNIGSGFEISAGETAHLIAELMGRTVEIDCEAERLRPAASEVERLWADTTEAARRFGWAPSHGGRDGFRRGLERTIAWFCDPANLALYGEGYQL